MIVFSYNYFSIIIGKKKMYSDVHSVECVAYIISNVEFFVKLIVIVFVF